MVCWYTLQENDVNYIVINDFMMTTVFLLHFIEWNELWKQMLFLSEAR